MSGYEHISEATPLTPARLLLELTTSFSVYLDTLPDHTSFTPKDTYLFKADLQHGLPLEDKLRATVDIDWQSNQPIDPADMMGYSADLAHQLIWAPEHTGAHIDHVYARELDTSPAVIYMRRWLGLDDSDDRLKNKHLGIWYGFIDSVSRKYFQEKPDTPVETATRTLQLQFERELELTAELPEELEELAAELQLLLTHEAWGLTNDDTIFQLKAELSELYSSEESIFEQSRLHELPAHLQKIRQCLSKHLQNPFFDESQMSRRKLQRVKLEKDGEIYFDRIISTESFFFNHPEEITVEDNFPQWGQMKMQPGSSNRDEIVSGYKDTSYFDSQGLKVFWGDMKYDEIKSLRGTYYVLSQSASYHSVPELAVVINTGQVSADPFRPPTSLLRTEAVAGSSEKLMLEIDYIRLHAVGAVVNGQFIKNPAQVV